MIKIIIVGFAAILGAFLVLQSACKSDAQIEREQFGKDVEAISDYIAKKQITNVITLESGLAYRTITEGTGGNPSINSTVSCYYKGYLTDDSVFDQTDNTKPAISFPLSNVIKGWQEGIPKMKKGSKTQFFIPSKLAYGKTAQGKIPANSVLVFEVELVNF